MKPLVEELLLYVGTNVGLPTELDKVSNRLRTEMKQQLTSVKSGVSDLRAELVLVLVLLVLVFARAQSLKEQAGSLTADVKQLDAKVGQLDARITRLGDEGKRARLMRRGRWRISKEEAGVRHKDKWSIMNNTSFAKLLNPFFNYSIFVFWKKGCTCTSFGSVPEA